MAMKNVLLAVTFVLTSITVEAQPFAYVVNQASNSVSVVDTQTNTVVATVPVGIVPMGVAVGPDGAFAYVTNTNTDSVSVIDTASNTVVATVPVGSFPGPVAITPDGAFAYVVNIFSDFLSVIDTGSNTVAATVPIGSQQPGGVAMNPVRALAYVSSRSSNSPDSVLVIDRNSNTVVATVPFGGGGTIPSGIAVTPDGAFAWVAILGAGSVYVIDTESNTVVNAIRVGSCPAAVAITPDGALAYVVNQCDPSVSVIDTATYTVVATVPVGGGGTQSAGIAVTPDGAFAYVTNLFSDSVSVIDTHSNTVVATVPVGSQPYGISIKPAPPLAITRLWAGLKNSDDQGTRFDLRAALYVNGTLVTEGLIRCVAGITRNPADAKKLSVALGPTELAAASGDLLSLKLLTRIGTNPDGSKCPGHSNAQGLRVYYDAVSRPARLLAKIAPDPLADYFLHSSGTNFFLDTILPTSTNPKQKDSGPVNFAGGNPWVEIGTWSRSVP